MASEKWLITYCWLPECFQYHLSVVMGLECFWEKLQTFQKSGLLKGQKTPEAGLKRTLEIPGPLEGVCENGLPGLLVWKGISKPILNQTQALVLEQCWQALLSLQVKIWMPTVTNNDDAEVWNIRNLSSATAGDRFKVSYQKPSQSLAWKHWSFRQATDKPFSFFSCLVNYI